MDVFHVHISPEFAELPPVPSNAPMAALPSPQADFPRADLLMPVFYKWAKQSQHLSPDPAITSSCWEDSPTIIIFTYPSSVALENVWPFMS